MSDQKPIKTGPSDKHLDSKTSSNQGKVIDTAKLGLTRQKLDESTLPPDSQQQERIKRKAREIKWWDTNTSQDSSSTSQGTSNNETSSPAKKARKIAEETQYLAKQLEKSEQDLQSAADSKNLNTYLPLDVLQTAYDTDVYLWEEHTKSLGDQSRTSKLESKHAAFSDSSIRKTMKKWNDTQCNVDDIKAT